MRWSIVPGTSSSEAMIARFDSAGAHAAAKNRRRALSTADADRVEAVEEDLHEEDARQQRADAVVVAGVDGVGGEQRVHAEDQRRGERPRRAVMAASTMIPTEITADVASSSSSSCSRVNSGTSVAESTPPSSSS